MSAVPWLALLSCGHYADFPQQPDPGTVIACAWPPHHGHPGTVASAAQITAADEDRLMRGEAVPGARGACTRQGCAHAQTRHHPRERTDRHAKPKACHITGCRCPGWTNQSGQVLPPAPLVQGDLFELLGI